MKICPKCNRRYEYEMTFCLQDGERLVLSGSTEKTTARIEESAFVLPQQNNNPAEQMMSARQVEMSQSGERSGSGSSAEKPLFTDLVAQPKTNKNLVVGILCGLLVVFGVLIGSWGYNPFAGVGNGVSTNSNQNTNLAPPPAESGSDMTQFNEAFYESLKGKLAAWATKNGLKPLASVSLPKESIELRLYLLADFYGPIYKGVTVEDSNLILKREKGVWSGRIIRNVIKANSANDAKEKIVTPLNEPLSGWDNLWQKLREQGVAAPPTKSERAVRTGSALYAVESRENGKYSYFYFHVPKEKSEIDEERRIAAIFNLVAKEFDASDLKAY
jgi:hypothetical protein